MVGTTQNIWFTIELSPDILKIIIVTAMLSEEYVKGDSIIFRKLEEKRPYPCEKYHRRTSSIFTSSQENQKNLGNTPFECFDYYIPPNTYDMMRKQYLEKLKGYSSYIDIDLLVELIKED